MIPIAARMQHAIEALYVKLGRPRPSQSAVAADLGIPRQHWWRYVHGGAVPTVDTVATWLEAWNKAHPDLALALEWTGREGWVFFAARR